MKVLSFLFLDPPPAEALHHLVVSLLVVVGLVSTLAAGVRVLFVRPLLAVGISGGWFLLGRGRPHEGSDDARLLEDEPEVPRPQHQVDEAKSLEKRRCEKKMMLLDNPVSPIDLTK